MGFLKHFNTFANLSSCIFVINVLVTLPFISSYNIQQKIDIIIIIIIIVTLLSSACGYIVDVLYQLFLWEIISRFFLYNHNFFVYIM